MEWLRSYQHEFLRQAQGHFQELEQPSQFLHLLDLEGHDLVIHCPIASTASQLLAAQRICLGWNEAGGVTHDGQAVPLHAFLRMVGAPIGYQFNRVNQHKKLHPLSLPLASPTWGHVRCVS